MQTPRLLGSVVSFVFLLALIGPDRAAAQTGAATLTGIVTVQSGAAVPGAAVTATYQATSMNDSAVPNEAGSYTLKFFFGTAG